MRASFGSLLVVPWILFAQSSWNMDAVPVITALQPSSEATVEVRDRGAVFSRGAERLAREAMQRIHREHAIPIRIETIQSLDGAWIADVAQRHSRVAEARQLYVLVAGAERDVGVVAARHGPASRLTDQQREKIRRAFLGPLQAGKADEALAQGVRAIGTTLDATTPGPGPYGRGVLIAGATLLGVLVVLLISQNRAWYGARSGRRPSPPPEVRRPGRSAARPPSAPRCRESSQPYPQPTKDGLPARPERRRHAMNQVGA